jgi:uncharacterized protein
MIIDAFAHVSPTFYGSTERYLEQLRLSGIAQGVISPGSMLDVSRMSDYLTGKAKANQDVSSKNAYVEQSAAAHPLLHGLVCLDPNDPQAAHALGQALKRGFKGLMLAPLVHEFSFADDGVAILAEFCGEHRVPLSTPVSFRQKTGTAALVRLAQCFPATNFVLQHMGAGPADPEATAAATTLDNLFLETSLGSYLHILETVRRAGASKLLFGSEFPLSHPAVELQKILLLPITDREREQILGGNIRELLRLDWEEGRQVS